MCFVGKGWVGYNSHYFRLPITVSYWLHDYLLSIHTIVWEINVSEIEQVTDTNQSTLYSHIQVLWKSDDTVNWVHCKVWDVKYVNKSDMESGYTVKYDKIYAEKIRVHFEMWSYICSKIRVHFEMWSHISWKLRVLFKMWGYICLKIQGTLKMWRYICLKIQGTLIIWRYICWKN